MTDRMGPSPILFVIHVVTIGTMLNNNGGNDGHALKKTLRVNRPSGMECIDITSVHKSRDVVDDDVIARRLSFTSETDLFGVFSYASVEMQHCCKPIRKRHTCVSSNFHGFHCVS